MRRQPNGKLGTGENRQTSNGLVNKVRTDIAMKATKLNAQVQLTNLQAMYERGKATSDQLELEYQDWARLQGRGPHTAGGHGRNRHVGWQAQ